MTNVLQELCSQVPPAPNWRTGEAYAHSQRLTMPEGSVEALLEPALRLLSVGDRWRKETKLKIASLVAAADHRLAAESPQISAYPQVVTRQMVGNFIAGGSFQSVLSRKRACSLHVVDAGVAGAAIMPTGLAGTCVSFHSARPCSNRFPEFSHGCLNPTATASLGKVVFEEMLRHGARVMSDILERHHPHLVCIGEMGIGNTTASAAISLLVSGRREKRTLTVDLAVGAGTGITTEALALKRDIVSQVLKRVDMELENTTDREYFSEILAETGGLEHAFLAGSALQAASRKVHILLDGLITTSALAPIWKICPQLQSWCLLAHESAEPAHHFLAHEFHLHPLLKLGLRLGEGSGAILAAGLIDDAWDILHEMATFDSAQVAAKHIETNETTRSSRCSEHT